MKSSVKQFIAGAFGLIALFLLLTHSSGFARDIGAGTSGTANVFKTLQGR
ncbi:MAG: hypothetical protein ACJ768_09400 [Gaiellaceae bacterium]